MKKLKALLLLTDYARQLAPDDLVARQRLKLFRITGLLSFVIIIGFSVQVQVVAPKEYMAIGFMYGLFAVVLTNYFLLPFHKRPRITYSVLVLSWLLLLHIDSYYSEGVRNAANFYLPTIILTAYILLGRRGGQATMAAAAAHLIWFFIIGQASNWISNELSGDTPTLINVYFFITTTVGLLMLNALATYIERGKNAIIDDLQRKRAELTEKNTELERLSLIAKETENAVVIITPDRKTTWVNAAFTRMTGFTYEEIIGQIPGQLLEGPGTDPETKHYIQEQYKKGVPFEVEILNYKKNGEPFWSEMYIEPLFDANGEVEQFFSIRKDITERKKLQQQLEEQRKQTTAAVIAAQEGERAQVGLELHDNVNQVLTTVKLYTELCRDGIGNTQEIMNKSIKLLQDSINEIRSLSKRLSAPTLGSIKLIDSIKELVDAVAATGKITIELEATGIETLQVSQEVHLALYRILQEHLTNVLKHADASTVRINIHLKETRLCMKVDDDGKGFDPQHRGSGIGITNMTTRAASLEGTLHIESEPGNGCALTLCIPVCFKRASFA